MTMSFSHDALLKLQRYDTPTICNAIELAQGKRGFCQYTKKMLFCSDVHHGPLVGFARTAKISGNKPAEALEDVRKMRLDYFRYMAAGPRPSVCVVEDIDFPNAVAAWWGEVHTAVHKGLGLSGALTNGVMRDLGSMEPGFPVIAGSTGPSHAYVHVREIDTCVDIMGLMVKPGDLIHADRHGAVVIPQDIYAHLQLAIDKVLAAEQIILGPAREMDFTIEKLEDIWKKFEKSRV